MGRTAVPPRSVAFLAALLSVASVLVQALYEDEVGQHEWHVEHVGEPTALEFSSDASDVLVASASGVVAAVSVKDGAMQWRRIGAEQPMKLLRASGKFIVTATSEGLVQGWKRSNGDLTWQREYSSDFVDLVIVGGAAKQTAVVLRAEEVDARTMTGKHEWSLAASAIGTDLSFKNMVQDGEALCAVLATSGSAKSATAVRIDVETGKVTSTADMPAAVAKALQAASLMTVDSYIVTLVGTSLSAYPMCGEGQSHSFDLKNLKTSSKVPFSLKPWQRTAGVFAVTNGESTVVFGLGAKGLKNLRSFDGRAVVGHVLSVQEDEGGQPVAVAMTTATGTQIQLLDPASGNVQPPINVEGYASTDHGDAKLLVVQELSSGEHRTVLTAADYSIAGIRGSKIKWAREEALSSIQHAFICGSRGESNPKGAIKIGATSTLQWVADVASAPMRIASSIAESFTSVQSERKKSSVLTMMPGTKLPTNDDDLRSFGGDKLIIASTSAFKIFALEATSSEIMWSKYFGKPNEDCAASDRGKLGRCELWMQLLPETLASRSELLVVMPLQGKSFHRFLWVDPQTGAVLHDENAPAGVEIASVSEIPRRHSNGEVVRPIMIVDAQRRAYAIPAGTEEPQRLIGEIGDQLYHYEIDSSASSVQGYNVGKSEKPGSKLVQLWNLELGFVGEKIIASAVPLHREFANVPVYIKGDASVLYKYINPNLVAVASVDTQTKNNVSALKLYALDSVTGRVLHQSRIVGGDAPVHMVACDNWVVAHYWNSKKIRFEITVMELFEAKPDDGPWNLLFGQGGSNQTKSAYTLEAPVPLQHTYIAPAGMTAFGVTATQKGITPRSILMALTTDHVYRVSKDMLNPRRPHANGQKDDTPTQFAPTKDEGVPPYAPFMPWRPTDVITHYSVMTRVRGIVSAPTALESTSLVFCYGLDLFFLPVQPAKGYDVLSPGFNYKLVYASLAVVLIASVVSTYLARYKGLQERWK